MAHALAFIGDMASIAYKGEKPWHGLGQEMQDGMTLDQWRVAAGLDWEAKKQKVEFWTPEGYVKGDSNILYRSDNQKELGIVSDDYKVLQPKQVLDFYADLVADHGFEMETAGALHDGKRIWALARTGKDFRVAGNDLVQGYCLLATSFDKSLATRVQFTSVRVVCQNTLAMSYNAAKGTDYISVPHSAIFDDRRVKIDMGIYAESADTFEYNVNKLAMSKVSREDAVAFIMELMAPEAAKEGISTRKLNQVNEVVNLFAGRGKGSDLRSADGTLWGVVNAVTEYVDHYQGRTANTRMNSAWFGAGAELKSKAFKSALALAA